MATLDPNLPLDEIATEHRKIGIQFPIANIQEQIEKAKTYWQEKEEEKKKKQSPSEKKG